jgi:hypothetical protein
MGASNHLLDFDPVSHFEPLVTAALFSSPLAVLGPQLGLDLSIVSQFLAIRPGLLTN